MSEKTPVGWTPLTPEQWTHSGGDHTSLFTREEVAAALHLLAPPEEAAKMVRELYGETREAGTVFFYGELLTALGSLSDSAAERVRSVQAAPARAEPPE